MSINGPRIYFEVPVFGGIPITETTVSLLAVTLILCIAGVLLGRGLKKRPGKMQVLVEKGVAMLRNLVVSTMGPHNERWVPFIGTIFLSSILGSLIGMTGFLKSTTANVTVNLVWSVSVSAIIWYNSIKNYGFSGWLKGFTEPIWVMTPINIVSELAQPLSMAFRHFGNVIGGSVISSLFYSALASASSMIIGLIANSHLLVCLVVLAAGVALLIPKFQKRKVLWRLLGILSAALGVLSLLEHFQIIGGIPILQIGIPAILSLYFDLFSGFIQAFVFCLLTMVYISGACPPPEAPSDSPSEGD